MNRDELFAKVQSTQTLDKDKLLGWINSMPKTGGKVVPSSYKVGDVFMHPIFQHPYILLENKNKLWMCVLLTSDSEFREILEPCESRFFDTSFICKSLFTTKEPIGSFMGVYENLQHLKKIHKGLKELFL